MSTFEVSISNHRGTPVLKLAGEARLSIETLEEAALHLKAERPALLVVDVSGLSYMSSLTMGALVKLHRAINSQGGKVKFAGAQPRIQEVLQYARLDTLFELCASVDDALGTRGEAT